ncbi:PREDICTED: probable pectate lyase P59 [Ipomoea nil]|uniref:probable pectate lyase P59 n=1 Tax=Ipomoea nil TaxID=35883 RepID=UPI000900B8C3|nr:PREDICTED: probable pectate lyase P59 [Ipomoea nil]
MAGFNINCFCMFLVTFAIILPSISGHIAEWDEVWQQRKIEAWEHALKTFEPDPSNVSAAFNDEVHKTLLESKNEPDRKKFVNGSDDTRRQLAHRKPYNGPCNATNPIDRCWRCQPNWANNRRRLADCGMGFGRKAIGGKHGVLYVVNDHSDDPSNPKPGTLRHAVIQKKPLWIIFSRDMNIRLNQELIMQSDKTIDGRGFQVHVSGGAGITLQFIKNVIIHGIRVHDIVQGSGGMIRDGVDHYGLRTRSDGDGISIFGSSDVWVDHVSMRNCYDGLIDAIEASTAITISNGHFTDHNDVMLFGANDFSPKDKIMQITIAFNHFGKRLVQRMPRCRFGYIHVVNNDYTHWNMYAIGGSSDPTIISQGNRFIAPPDIHKKEITHRVKGTPQEWMQWTWRSQGDIYMSGAFFVQSGDPNFMSKHHQLYDGIQPFKAEDVTWLTRFAGALNCRIGSPC